MGDGVLGYDEINMSQSILQHTTGTRDATATTTVGATITTQGSTTITLSQASVTTTLTAGDVFTVAGVYAVNPQTRQSTGSLQQFVVTAAATAVAGTWYKGIGTREVRRGPAALHPHPAHPPRNPGTSMGWGL